MWPIHCCIQKPFKLHGFISEHIFQKCIPKHNKQTESAANYMFSHEKNLLRGLCVYGALVQLSEQPQYNESLSRKWVIGSTSKILYVNNDLKQTIFSLRSVKVCTQNQTGGFHMESNPFTPYKNNDQCCCHASCVCICGFNVLCQFQLKVQVKKLMFL